MLPGQVRLGASISVTVTLKLHDVEFPSESVAVQVTVASPTEKVEPGLGSHEGDNESPQSSVAVGRSKFTTAEQTPGSV